MLGDNLTVLSISPSTRLPFGKSAPIAPPSAWAGVATERRRRENDLGETLYFGVPYYARWLLASAKMLIDKGHITPDELTAKMEEVRKREEEASA